MKFAWTRPESILTTLTATRGFYFQPYSNEKRGREKQQKENSPIHRIYPFTLSIFRSIGLFLHFCVYVGVYLFADDWSRLTWSSCHCKLCNVSNFIRMGFIPPRVVPISLLLMALFLFCFVCIENISILLFLTVISMKRKMRKILKIRILHNI